MGRIRLGHPAGEGSAGTSAIGAATKKWSGRGKTASERQNADYFNYFRDCLGDDVAALRTNMGAEIGKSGFIGLGRRSGEAAAPSRRRRSNPSSKGGFWRRQPPPS
jgi:hypothetical protein